MNVSLSTRRRRAAGLATAIATVLLCASCASNSAAAPSTSASSAPKTTTNVTFTLNYLPGALASGFSMAKEKGYYKEAGLNVSIEPGTGSLNTAKLVASGQSPIGYSDAPSTFSTVAGGGNIKYVAPIYGVNVFAIFSLKASGITSVKDLVGKSVAVQPGTAQTELFNAVLESNGVSPSSVKTVSVAPAALIGALRNHTVDAILGGADAHGPLLRSMNVPFNEQLFAKSGVPTVGFGIIANPTYLKEHPAVVKAFVAASLQGWAAARKNPHAAALAVSQQFPTAGTVAVIEDGLRSTAPLMCGIPGMKDLSALPAGTWAKTQTLLVKYAGLPKSPPISDSITTSSLPANPPAC